MASLESKHNRLVAMVATDADARLGQTLYENEALLAELTEWNERSTSIKGCYQLRDSLGLLPSRPTIGQVMAS